LAAKLGKGDRITRRCGTAVIPEPFTVPIASIVPTRHSPISWVMVEEYRQMLLQGLKAPPIEVVQMQEGRWLIWNGHHRWKAAVLERRAEILVVQVRPG
jgi:hypothetical protein